MNKLHKFLVFFLLTFVLTVIVLSIAKYFLGIFDDWGWIIGLSLGNATGNAVVNTFFINNDEKEN